MGRRGKRRFVCPLSLWGLPCTGPRLFPQGSHTMTVALTQRLQHHFGFENRPLFPFFELADTQKIALGLF